MCKDFIKIMNKETDSLNYHVGLSALLEQDLSSYEYFHSLPQEIQKKIEHRDLASFEEMQEFVSNLKK